MTRTCTVCGLEFEPRTHNQKGCSVKCRKFIGGKVTRMRDWRAADEAAARQWMAGIKQVNPDGKDLWRSNYNGRVDYSDPHSAVHEVWA